MPTILKIILITYLIAVNFYGILILGFQKKDKNKSKSTNISDFQLLLTALIGGASGIYLFMFIFKYKLRSIIMMLILPILIVINISISIQLFNGTFWFN